MVAFAPHRLRRQPSAPSRSRAGARKSGPLRSFGVNSEAVLTAAVQAINDAGGVKLGDGTMAPMELTYYDSACNADQAISVARKVESQTEALIGIGPTCSGAAAAMYGIFQKTVDDASDTGLQFPILTDTAIRPGLAKKSQWTFRNVPNEITMYDELFSWLRAQYPDVKTIYGGTETDQAHSKLTFAIVIVPMAKKHGFEWVGGGIEGRHRQGEGGLRERAGGLEVVELADGRHELLGPGPRLQEVGRGHDDRLLAPVHHLRHAEGDEAPAHQAQRARGTHQLVQRGNAEGLLRRRGRHVHPDRLRADHGCRRAGRGRGRGQRRSADLHSAAAWENAHIIKQVVESTGIMAKPETLQADRRKMRDGLEALVKVDGLMGEIGRVQDEGESVKPYVFVQADRAATWKVVHDPRRSRRRERYGEPKYCAGHPREPGGPPGPEARKGRPAGWPTVVQAGVPPALPGIVSAASRDPHRRELAGT